MFDYGLMVILGVVSLYVGGQWLVKSASRLALSFGATALVVGLTIVAWATSAPEMVVNVSAALQGSTKISLGNVLGSNIVNIGLCLGLMALLFSVKASWQLIRREISIMIGVTILLFLLALDGSLSQFDGILLTIGFVIYNTSVYILAHRERQQIALSMETYEKGIGLTNNQISRWFEVGRLMAGLGGLILGANLTVGGATALARMLGVTEFVIGLTLVALGTSLPELAASLVAARQGQTDIALGNVIGSNIANILGILGVTMIVQPIAVTPDVLRTEFPIVLVFSIALLLFSRRGLIRRWQAGLLLTGYVGFVLFTLGTSLG